jgi:hypothetical protein
LSLTQSRVNKGNLNTVDFQAIGNFCFDSGTEARPEAGQIRLSVSLEDGASASDYTGLQIVVFRDDIGWPKIFDSNSGSYKKGSCQDRYDAADAPDMANRAVNFGQVRTFPVNQRSRARFWYVALTCCAESCQTSELGKVRYEIEMLNNQQGWPSSEIQFGFDENGIQYLYVIYFVIFILYFFAHGYALFKLRELNGTIHQFILIFTFIAVIEFVSVGLFMVHWFRYGSDGMGIPLLSDIGTLLDFVSRVLFMGLLMFLAEGWTITEFTLSARSKKIIVGSLSCTAFLYSMLLVWQFLARTPEMIKPPLAQRVLTYLLCAAWLGFCGYLVMTCMRNFMAQNPNDEAQAPKRRLFLLIGIVYGIWILSFPTIAWVGEFLDEWVYFIVVTSAYLTFSFLGFWVFTAIIWPSHASKYFNEPTRTASALGASLVGGDDFHTL